MVTIPTITDAVIQAPAKRVRRNQTISLSSRVQTRLSCQTQATVTTATTATQMMVSQTFGDISIRLESHELALGGSGKSLARGLVHYRIQGVGKSLPKLERAAPARAAPRPRPQPFRGIVGESDLEIIRKALAARVSEAAREPEKAMARLVAEGFYTAEGELTASYGGPPATPLPRPDPTYAFSASQTL